MTKCLPGGKKRDKFVSKLLKYFGTTEEPNYDIVDVIVSSLNIIPEEWIMSFENAYEYFNFMIE